jgi:hypothetical protein
MADRRRATLLQFAIAATIAVVPVLYGVLLIVVAGRPDRVAQRRSPRQHPASRR